MLAASDRVSAPAPGSASSCRSSACAPFLTRLCTVMESLRRTSSMASSAASRPPRSAASKASVNGSSRVIDPASSSGTASPAGSQVTPGRDRGQHQRQDDGGHRGRDPRPQPDQPAAGRPVRVVPARVRHHLRVGAPHVRGDQDQAEHVYGGRQRRHRPRPGVEQQGGHDAQALQHAGQVGGGPAVCPAQVPGGSAQPGHRARGQPVQQPRLGLHPGHADPGRHHQQLRGGAGQRRDREPAEQQPQPGHAGCPGTRPRPATAAWRTGPRCRSRAGCAATNQLARRSPFTWCAAHDAAMGGPLA